MVESYSYYRCPRIFITDDVLESDGRLTINGIASTVNLSPGSIHSIIREELAFSKISARWDFRLLSLHKKGLN